MTHRRTAWATVSALTLWVAVVSAADIGATLIDRQGNRYELTKIEILGHAKLEYYVGGTRKDVELSEVSRFRFGSGAREEQQEFTIHLRTGRVETGTFVISAAVPNADVLGGGGLTESISGSTRFGPFSIMLRDVAEVILVHPDGGGLIAAPPELRATVVNERGRSFDVDKLRYRGQRELAFQQGRRRRELDMGRIERIEFKEPGTEQRTIVISLRSGKTITATVDASTVRLSGERDQQYWSRVDSAFTGRAGAARFGIGLQDIRLIVLHEERADSTAAPTAEADTTSP